MSVPRVQRVAWMAMAIVKYGLLDYPMCQARFRVSLRTWRRDVFWLRKSGLDYRAARTQEHCVYFVNFVETRVGHGESSLFFARSRGPDIVAKPQAPMTILGQTLTKDFLQAYGIPRTAFAKRVGLSIVDIEEISFGRTEINAQLAQRFARTLGTSPKFWLDLQFQASKSPPRTERR